jgi:hypothetical protein
MKLAVTRVGVGTVQRIKAALACQRPAGGSSRTTEHARALFKPGGAQPLNINPAGTRIDDLIVLLHPFERACPDKASSSYAALKRLHDRLQEEYRRVWE